MTKLAIFASGKGSNARAIIDYFNDLEDIKVSLIVTNRKTAGVLDLAQEKGILSLIFSKSELESDGAVLLEKLRQQEIDLIILAGFLLKVPDYLIQAFPEAILNIHPALLPKYGGKGMYGKYVHQAVYDNKDSESGITIHLVNEHYDEGKILFQASVELTNQDEPDDIASKVLELEHYYFPRVIEAYAQNGMSED